MKISSHNLSLAFYFGWFMWVSRGNLEGKGKFTTTVKIFCMLEKNTELETRVIFSNATYLSLSTLENTFILRCVTLMPIGYI
jgi:hypothetical protein